MRRIFTSLIVGTSLLTLSAAASAGSQGYETDISAVPSSAIRIDVGISEDLSYRADNVPRGVKCPQAKGRNSGFACNGYLGEKDLTRLAGKLEKWTTKSLTKKGIVISEDADVVLKLTLVDAKNNRPTFNQLSKQPGLSFRSVAIGGAEVEGELFASDGTSIGTLSYSYYDTFFDEFTQTNGIWSDANRAIQSFSRRLAKDFALRNQTKA